jgi:RNA recognition motif
MSALLFFINVPYNCSDHELQEWIESSGIEIESIRLVRDLVAGVSPAFAYAVLRDQTRLEEAISYSVARGCETTRLR